MKLVEITSLRSTFGGLGSRVAINRHSTRLYILNDNDKDLGFAIYVDRNLSTVPASFTVSYYKYETHLGAINGRDSKNIFDYNIENDLIDSCLSWKAIEKELKNILSSSDIPLKFESDLIIEKANSKQNFFNL